MSKIELKIFLSSPGDVADERKLVLDVFEELNADPFIRDRARIEVIAWEDPKSQVLMPVSLTPQQAIDIGLPKPSETDATIVIFWQRMGTPLDIESHKTKENGEPYLSGTEWEYLEARRGAQKHPQKLPIVLLFRRLDYRTPPKPTDYTDAEDFIKDLRGYTDQFERVLTFFKQFRDENTGAYRAGINNYKGGKFRELFEQQARALVNRLIEIKSGTPLPPEPEQPAKVWKGSPFPGLQPFTEAEEAIFFGREVETSDLLKRLNQHRLMFVVGASGSGKSSLVGAGVIPQLKRGAILGVNKLYIVRLTPHNAPFLQLAEALINEIPYLKDDGIDEPDFAFQLANDLALAPETLAEHIAQWFEENNEPENTELFLFVDQLEEIFASVDPDDRDVFMAMMQHHSPHIRVVTTMRSDFYPEALPYFEAVWRDAMFPLSIPHREALAKMIEAPAQKAGLEIENGLVTRILNAVDDQPANLTLMAYTLDELYQMCSHDGKLTNEAYDALGGLERSIATRAEVVFDKIEGDEEQKQESLEQLFSMLVEIDRRGTPIRKRASKHYVSEIEHLKPFVDAFSHRKVRLLVSGGNRENATIEVAHEALFQHWKRLSDWIELRKDDLILLDRMRQAAYEWDINDRQPEYLWRGDRNARMLTMLKRLGHIRLKPVEEAFARPESELLIEIIEDPETTHAERHRISADLQKTGDTRRGVGTIIERISNQDIELPDISWIYVDVPSFMLGKPNPFADNQGREYIQAEVKPFYMAKFQITYRQFETFLDARDGFENSRWWRGMGRYMRQAIKPQKYKFGSYPRDSISWYQAVAFTNWLNHKYNQMDFFDTLPTGENRIEQWQIRLPLEWEWQWVAQNGLSERTTYPWGNTPQQFATNSSESGHNSPLAVGMYPNGQSPHGIMDLCGNTREWCFNKFQATAADVVDDSNDARVIRGGCFYEPLTEITSAHRNKMNPNSFNSGVGFRVICGSKMIPWTKRIGQRYSISRSG